MNEDESEIRCNDVVGTSAFPLNIRYSQGAVSPDSHHYGSGDTTFVSRCLFGLVTAPTPPVSMRPTSGTHVSSKFTTLTSVLRSQPRNLLAKIGNALLAPLLPSDVRLPRPRETPMLELAAEKHRGARLVLLLAFCSQGVRVLRALLPASLSRALVDGSRTAHRHSEPHLSEVRALVPPFGFVAIACVSSPRDRAISVGSHMQQDVVISLAPPRIPVVRSVQRRNPDSKIGDGVPSDNVVLKMWFTPRWALGGLA